MRIKMEEFFFETNLSSKAFISQEIEDLLVLEGEPSSRNRAQDQAIRLAGFGHPPRRDPDCVVSRFG